VKFEYLKLPLVTSESFLEVLAKVLVGCKQYWPKNGKTNSGANAPAKVGAVKAFPESPGSTQINNRQTDI
jgi:hypothetical protein